MNRERIWELDALRGFFILCVIVIHAVFDLRFFVLGSFSPVPVFDAIQKYGGVVFVLLSGICATLGSRSFRRGLVVFSCGMLITLVTWGMYVLGFTGQEIVIRFGVLHLLGLCMILYPLAKKLPNAALVGIGLPIVFLGYWFASIRVENPYLFVLGLITEKFSSGDYFPLFPHLGWFLLGAAFGKTAYREKKSLLPNFSKEAAPVRLFRFCGRHSLLLYLAHQPVLYALIVLPAPLYSR